MGQPHPEIQKFVQTFENAMQGDGLTDLHSGGVAAARTLTIRAKCQMICCRLFIMWKIARFQVKRGRFHSHLSAQ